MTAVRSQDLVLTVSQQSSFSVRSYQKFLDQLTLIGGQHQYDALEIATRYLLGGQYADLNELAAENWANNERIREHWGHQEDRFLAAQQLGSLLAASIDHATATGKSYVIFGAAVLALASGQVDRVLVLAPSKTIEEGLTKKFHELSTSRELMDLLPDEAAVRAPVVVNAYEGTVPPASICVENIHAAYERSLSSIRESFESQGERTLVINDEAHHIYTIEAGSGSRKVKEWLAFLIDDAFGFRRVLNVSGTCFIGNSYFPDVIHRYSVQEARQERRIKDIRYWDSGQEFPSPEARWNAVLENHEDNRSRYTGIKPITIFVTDKVDKAKDIHAEFKRFLVTHAGLTEETAADRTLVVSSRKEHEPNLPSLRSVDQPGNEVEFIFSVSMLTEGWDVKNVLQIVPHEKRAFDSKLLISQVLGRGLRLLPEPYRDARVIVFNHAKWAPEMRRLFEDVWEDDQRIISTPVANSPHHFDLDLLQVQRGSVPAPATGKPQGRQAGEPLSLLQQRARETAGVLVDLAGRKTEQRRYEYLEPVQPLEDLLAEIRMKDEAAALEDGGSFTDRTDELRAEIAAALRTAKVPTDEVSQTNRTRILEWLRPTAIGRRMAFKTTTEQLDTVLTKGLAAQSVGRSQLSHDAVIALRADNGRAIRWPDHDTGQYDLLDAILKDPALRRGATIEVAHADRWRTPVDLVGASHTPELRFLEDLIHRGPEVGVDAWIKSPDVGFYAVPYTISRNAIPRNLAFNPDWFLRVGDDILVVETKMDKDASAENKAKFKSATAYFEKVNELRIGKSGTYHFFFVTPSDYTAFFKAIADRDYAGFASDLQVSLGQ